MIGCDGTGLDAKEARKLAQWLIKAADYLDSKLTNSNQNDTEE